MVAGRIVPKPSHSPSGQFCRSAGPGMRAPHDAGGNGRRRLLLLTTVAVATLTVPTHAFASWVLAFPPHKLYPDQPAPPVRTWTIVKAFDTARECEAERVTFVSRWQGEAGRLIKEFQRCLKEDTDSYFRCLDRVEQDRTLDKPGKERDAKVRKACGFTPREASDRRSSMCDNRAFDIGQIDA